MLIIGIYSAMIRDVVTCYYQRQLVAAADKAVISNSSFIAHHPPSTAVIARVYWHWCTSSIAMSFHFSFNFITLLATNKSGSNL